MPAQAPAKSPSLDWKKTHALGLPGGSVRAALALAIVFSIIALIYLEPDLGVPNYLQNLMFIIMGHYFAARHKYDPVSGGGPPPLWLPKGSVRVLMMFGFVGVAVALGHEGRASIAQPNQAVWTLLLVVGFFFGVVLSHALAWLSRRGMRPPRLVEDVRSLLSLGAALLLVAYLFQPRIGALASLAEYRDVVDRHRGGEILSTVVGFYFGSRS